jgi:hypothetical protein
MPRQTRPNPLNIFEETKIKVGVKVVKGMPKKPTAKFVFTKIGSNGAREDLAPIVVDLKKNVVSANEYNGELLAPTVPDGEDSYRLVYRLELGDQSYPQGQEWVVWPERLKVTTKKKVEGKLTTIGYCELVLTTNGTRRSEDMPLEGVRDILLPGPGPVTVELAAPAKFVQWLEGKEKGRERILEWEVVPCKAKFSSHEGGGEIKRYVNAPGESNEIDIEVATASDGGFMVGAQDVFVKVTFTNDTDRGKSQNPRHNAAYDAERTVTGLTDEKKSNKNLVWEGKVTSDDKGIARFKVTLGKGGGEKCEIKVGSTKTLEDDTLTFITWRKLIIGYTHSGSDLTKNLWSEDKRQATTDCFSELFIEIEYTPDMTAPKPLPQFADRGGWVDGTEVGLDPGEVLALNVADGRKGSWVQLAELTRPQTASTDLYIGIMACDKAFENQNAAGQQLVNKASGIGTVDGAEVARLELRGSTYNGGDVDTHFGKVPDKPLYKSKVTYQLKKMVKKDVDPSGLQVIGGVVDVAADNIKIEYKKKKPKDPNGGTCTIVFPDEVKTHLQADKMNVAEIIFSVLMVNDVPPAGISNGASAVLLDQGESSTKNLNNTACHEIGHAIGMCCDVGNLNPGGGFIDRIPDFEIAQHPTAKTRYLPAHGRWYTGRAHVGDHCAQGESDSSYKKWKDFGDTLAGYTCVIWGSGQLLTTPLKFCERCKKVILAMEVYVGKKRST